MATHKHEAESSKAQRPARQAPVRPGAVSSGALLDLQRTAGNRVVSRLLDAELDTVPDAVPDSAPVQRSSVNEVLDSPGTPLAAPVRSEMEARLGADFSDVRLHTGSAAQRSASEIGARAYTSGTHVVIGSGGTDKHTLAHELTHVIQQRQGPVAGTDNGSGLSISDPSDRFEREAEANARRAMSSPVSRVQTCDSRVSPAAGEVRGSVQRMPRPNNPNPHPQSLGNLTITAHHVVPYEIMEEYFEHPNTMSKFIPKRDQVSLSQMAELHLIPKLGDLDLGSLGSGSAVGHLKAADVEKNKGVPEETKRKIVKGLDDIKRAKKGEREDISDEHIASIARGFFAWAPANIFHGPPPERRDRDPGRQLDTDGQHFLGDDRYGVLKTLYEAHREAEGGVSKEEKKRLKKEKGKLFKKMAEKYNEVAPYDESLWKKDEDGTYYPKARQRRYPGK